MCWIDVFQEGCRWSYVSWKKHFEFIFRYLKGQWVHFHFEKNHKNNQTKSTDDENFCNQLFCLFFSEFLINMNVYDDSSDESYICFEDFFWKFSEFLINTNVYDDSSDESYMCFKHFSFDFSEFLIITSINYDSSDESYMCFKHFSFDFSEFLINMSVYDDSSDESYICFNDFSLNFSEFLINTSEYLYMCALDWAILERSLSAFLNWKNIQKQRKQINERCMHVFWTFLLDFFGISNQYERASMWIDDVYVFTRHILCFRRIWIIHWILEVIECIFQLEKYTKTTKTNERTTYAYVLKFFL